MNNNFFSTIRHHIILVVLISMNTLLIGCGGGGGGNSSSIGNEGGSLSTGSEYGSSSSEGNPSYYLTVSDDLILGARLTGTKLVNDAYGVARETVVCEGFRELGGGKYALNNCSQKPTWVNAVGGYIDLNENGTYDTDEIAQSVRLRVDTTVLTDTNFTVTPIATLAAGYPNGNRLTLAQKLGFSDRASAYRSTLENRVINRYLNGIFFAASENGLELSDFTLKLATKIVATSGVPGIAILKSSLQSLTSDTAMINLYGEAKIKSFLNDSRVQALLKESDPVIQMGAGNVSNGKLKFYGFVTTYLGGTSNGVGSATVEGYIGTKKIGSTFSDSYGKYVLEVDESDLKPNSTLLLRAETPTLKLTSSVPTNVVLEKRVNGKIDSSRIGGLMISHVTTLLNDNNNTIQSGATVKKMVFDASYYSGKLASNEPFFIPVTMLYEDTLLPGISNVAGMKPSDIDTDHLTKVAKSIPVTSGPIILDIESWPLPYEISSSNDTVVKNTVEMYVLVIKTMKAARPELKFGFFGTIPSISPYGPAAITDTMVEQAEHLYELTLPIAQASDFVTPELYTYWSDTPIYFRLKNIAFDMAQRYHKPLLPFLWAEYSDSTPQVGTYLPDTYWTNQILLAKDRGDALVIWGGARFISKGVSNGTRVWSESISWWKILKNNI